MDILSTKFEMEPFDNFNQVFIYDENGKFFIGLMTNGDNQSYIVFKNMIVGGFSFLNNKKEIQNIVDYFESFDDCILYLNQITTKSFLKIFKKGKLDNLKLLISIQDKNSINDSIT